MPLPKDKGAREDLLLQLAELKDHPGYLAVLDRLTTLQQLSQRGLESETQTPLLHQLQGDVRSYRKSIRAIEDIEAELKKE